MNDAVNVAYSLNVQIERDFDYYNSSKVVGKLIKVFFQLYMKGWFVKKSLQ